MTRLADRTTRISSAPTMTATATVDRLLREGVEVIDSGAGEPDLSTAEAISLAAREACAGGPVMGSKIVAVIGASSDRRKFGNRAVRAFVREGYTVIPINPHEQHVEGLQTYASVLDVPGPIDMASFYVPPDIGVQVIEQVASKRIAEVWLNPGSESDTLIARARELSIQPIVACSIVSIGQNPYAI